MCVLSAVGLLTGRVHGSQVTDIRLGVCIIWKFNCVCVLNPLLGVWECVFVGAYETWSVCDYVTARAHLSQNMCVCLQVCLRSCVCDRVHVIICTWLWGCDGVCPADSAPCVWERHGVGAVGWAGGSREMHCEQTAGVTEKGLKADLRAVLCLVAQSCPTLCAPMDCIPPGSSVHGDSPGKNTGPEARVLF